MATTSIVKMGNKYIDTITGEVVKVETEAPAAPKLTEQDKKYLNETYPTGNNKSTNNNSTNTGSISLTTTKTPVQTEQLYEQNPFNRYGLQKVVDTGNAYMITDAKGRKMTITKQAIDRNGLQTYIDDYGNFIDRSSDDDDRPWKASNNSNGTNTGSTDNISNMYEEQRKLLISQLKEKIAQAKGQYQGIVNKAPQMYQPMKNQAELNRVRGLDTLREIIANRGDSGGIGRQQLLEADTQSQNQLNSIELQQQNVINDANTAIAQLEAQGRFDEAQITAEMAMEKLRALIQEQQRAESLAIENDRWATERQDKLDQWQDEMNYRNRQYEDKQSELGRERTDAEKADRLRQELATLSRYHNNYQAEINRRLSTPDTADDELIPYLEAARQQKIKDEGLDQQGRPIQRGMSYEQALNLWKAYGIATADIAGILGVPIGAKTDDYLQTEYNIKKPYSGSNNTSSGGYGLKW